MATVKTPPPRGRPYYDVERGGMRIVPPGGGRAVDYVGPSEGFDARLALRRVGMRGREEGLATGRTAARTSRAVTRTLRRAGVGPELGVSRYGLGGLLIYVGASIIGLALLENLLGGRGPAAYARILGALGGGVKKLVDPADTIVPAGTVPPAGSAASVVPPVGARGPVGVKGGPAGLVPVPTNVSQRPGIRLDRRVEAAAVQVARLFGVKISSGYRSRAENAEVSGASNSDHLRGDAADFVGTPAQLQALYAWAAKQGFPYVEPLSQSKDHVHISFLRP